MKLMAAFLLFMPTVTFANNCEDVQIRIIFDRKSVITKEVLCSEKTSDNMIFYLSKSCIEKKCEILSRRKTDLVIKDYYKNIGSPGFKLCTALGGVPQIFEFSKDASWWQSTERCLFEKDFVEISLLTRQWKGFIKK